MKIAFFAGGLLAISSAALAAPINYGAFSGNTVQFLSVSEDSPTDPTPLFGTPTVTGDSIGFNPTQFGSFSSNGGSDITDGTLQMDIRANSGFSIPFFNISERGDYSLIVRNAGGTASASVGLALFIRISEVNGAALSTPVTFSGNGTFTPSGGSFTLSGIGTQLLQTFNGNISVDLNQLLANAGVTGSATRIQVSLNNVLTTVTTAGARASIQKKQFDGVSITIPTPGAAALVGMGVLAAGRRRR
jgi:uncharacterized protein (TIGR03382 family)